MWYCQGVRGDRRWLATCLVALGAGMLLVGGFYGRDYAAEQAELRSFLDGRPEFAPAPDPLPFVEGLTTYLAALPGDETTARMGYRNPLYQVLRARPIDVLHYGGFCGNKSRLMVTLLRLRGVSARVAYVFNEAGWNRPELGQPYITAFVEADLAGRWVVVDPLLGIVFRRADGSPATSADLAADPELVRARAPHWYRPELFNYREIRGLRWGKFPFGEGIHDLLARLISPGWVNDLHYPFWAHRPNLMLATASALLGLGCLVLGLVLRRAGSAEHAPSASRL
jgi:hypothetical protein